MVRVGELKFLFEPALVEIACTWGFGLELDS